MTLTLDIQNDSDDPCPEEPSLRQAVEAALTVAGAQDAAEISLRLVTADEMRDLNHRFRGKDRPTNVLSFPADLPADIPLPLLGDVVICTPVLAEEAREQGKSAAAHWAHLLVHGTLHLLGYDHIEETEAEHMEALETRALAMLGWPCPYHSDDHRDETCGDRREHRGDRRLNPTLETVS